LEKAEKNDLTFIADKKYHSYLDTTESDVILVSQMFETSKTLLIVPNPKLAFAKILEREKRPREIKPGVHSQSWIEEGVEVESSATIYPFVSVRQGAHIGKNVVLYPGVYIGEGVSIGDDSILYPNVAVYSDADIGKRVIVHSGTVLGADGFGYVWDGEKHYKVPQVGRLVIEDDVEIGANTAIDRGALEDTKIGVGSKIDNLVQIGHNCQVGAFCIICGQVGLAGRVKVGDGSILAGQVGTADGVKIAHGTKVSAQSGLMKDTKHNDVIAGSPAMDFKDYFKVVAHLKKLPEMTKKIRQLENEVKKLKEKS